MPGDGRRAVLRVRARRMRCPVTGCEVQAFREQVPGVLERYPRRTARLAGQVSTAARDLAGRAPARLLPAPDIAASRHAALRVLLRIRLPAFAVPRAPGTGGFATAAAASTRPSSSMPRPGGALASSRAAPLTSRRSGCRTTREPRSCAATGRGLRRGRPPGTARRGAGQRPLALVARPRRGRPEGGSGALRLPGGGHAPAGGGRAAATLERWQQVHNRRGKGAGLLECARRLGLPMSTAKSCDRASEPEWLPRRRADGRLGSAAGQGPAARGRRRDGPAARDDRLAAGRGH